MLDAIFYLGGLAWRQLPAELPPAKTVYGLFCRWAAAGAWARLHDALRDRARIRAGRHPKPTAAVIDSAAVTRCWQAYLRRFELEHTIRFAKQTLGWTAPKLRSPAAADRWTWLVLAAHTQLRLARRLTHDLRRPWERPLPVERLTPARLRRGFRYLRARTPSPASAPKPAHPEPGRPPGAKNRHRAPRYVEKTVTRAAVTSSERAKT